jgi:hypothetical protein
MPLIRLPKPATLMALRKFYELAATGFGCIHALGDFEAVWFQDRPAIGAKRHNRDHSLVRFCSFLML